MTELEQFLLAIVWVFSFIFAYYLGILRGERIGYVCGLTFKGEELDDIMDGVKNHD